MCILVATTAFGLGVDCPNIARVINYGSAQSLEELVQEAGCAKRDRHQAETILYLRKIGKKVTDALKEYEDNIEQCHRNCSMIICSLQNITVN